MASQVPTLGYTTDGLVLMRLLAKEIRNCYDGADAYEVFTRYLPQVSVVQAVARLLTKT